MIIVSDPGLVNVPPGWPTCEAELAKFTPPSILGFVGSPGDLNRFRSRYRLAKSFTAIVLESYRPETTAGYSALFRVFLTWSAFEQLLEICGLNLAGMSDSLAPYEPAAAEIKIRAIDGHADFLRFVHERLDHAEHRAQVDAFLNEKPCNLLYLPKGIRHIFAHGKLTPHSGTDSTEPARLVADALCEFLFQVMDGEFTRRLRDHGFAVSHGVAADSPPSHSLGPLATLARLAAERLAVRPMTNETPSVSSLEGLTLDEIFVQQDSAAGHNIAGSEVVRRRLEFLRDATAIAVHVLSTLPFEDEKQHAIRVLSMDAWSNLIISVRVGLWGNAPESFALLRCGVETAAILAAAVEQQRYKTAVSEFAKRQRQLSFDQAVKLLGETGKRITRLHGDLSDLGSHATGNRMRFASYTHEGEEYDRFACGLDPEAAAMSLQYALDLSLHLLTVLETAYFQDSRVFPRSAELERLRAEYDKARAW